MTAPAAPGSARRDETPAAQPSVVRVLCVDGAGRVLVVGEPDGARTRWSVPSAPGDGCDPHDAARAALVGAVGLPVDDLGPALPGAPGWYAVRTVDFEPPHPVRSVWVHPDELDALGGDHHVEPAETSTRAREAHELRPAALVRPTVRVLLVDASDRVLLMCVAGWWFPPGGGVDPGETHEQAARRELHEELGVLVTDVGPWVWSRRLELALDAQPGAPVHDLRERWHLLLVDADLAARLPADTQAVDRSRWTALEVATVQDVRWWTFEELAGGGAFAPRDLPTLLPALVDDARRGALAGRPAVVVPR